MVQPPVKQISADKVDGTSEGDCKKTGIDRQEGAKRSNNTNSKKGLYFQKMLAYSSPPRSGFVLLHEYHRSSGRPDARIRNGNNYYGGMTTVRSSRYYDRLIAPLILYMKVKQIERRLSI